MIQKKFCNFAKWKKREVCVLQNSLSLRCLSQPWTRRLFFFFPPKIKRPRLAITTQAAYSRPKLFFCIVFLLRCIEPSRHRLAICRRHYQESPMREAIATFGRHVVDLTCTQGANTAGGSVPQRKTIGKPAFLWILKFFLIFDIILKLFALFLGLCVLF